MEGSYNKRVFTRNVFGGIKTDVETKNIQPYCPCFTPKPISPTRRQTTKEPYIFNSFVCVFVFFEIENRPNNLNDFFIFITVDPIFRNCTMLFQTLNEPARIRIT